jgi:hypothetical protein
VIALWHSFHQESHIFVHALAVGLLLNLCTTSMMRPWHFHPLNSMDLPGIRLVPILLTPTCFEGLLTSIVEGLVKTFSGISLHFHHWQHH